MAVDGQYTVLARRFRPQTFSEVVGQDRIAQTLRNAIHEGRVAHAYLFTGARGVGKTSMARIFAKALNCPNAVDSVPCNVCEICQSIAAGQDVDVSEIDGASNRGIDDIRALRANVNIRSMRSKYKVYIIDEVHMLTREAFNALLKTLEEPPPAVKFVFCTTEPNKVPDTILSRCQRFDFGTVSTVNIVTRLEQIAEAEGFEVDAAALQLVARRAAGSMRDSQSLFDQVLAFGEKRITSADVHRLLGTAPDDRLVDLTEAILAKRTDESLNRFQSALDEGVPVDSLVEQLVLYFRDLMVMAAGAQSSPLLGVSEEFRDTVQAQAARWSVTTVVAALQILAETKARMQRVTFGRALAELAIVRLATLEEAASLTAWMGVLEKGGLTGVMVGSAAPQKKSEPPVPLATRTISSAPRISTIQVPADAAVPVTASPSLEAPISPLPVVSPETAAVMVADSPAEAVSPEVVWEAGCEGLLLKLLISKFPDMTGTYLQRTLSTAISGPNQLEFRYPAGYNLGARALSQSETIAKIEDALRRLTGQPIRFRLLLVADAPVEKVRPATPVPEVRAHSIEPPHDALVAEVGRLLGVEEWRCMPAPRPVEPEPVEQDID